MQFSTGLKNAILSQGGSGGNTNGGLSTLLNNCRIEFYANSPPASPDDAAGETAINTYSADDGATYNAQFEAVATGGVLNKAAAQTWSGTTTTGGTATWFRLLLTGDANGADATALRVQGTVGGPASDIYIADPVLAATTQYFIDAFAIAIPDL